MPSEATYDELFETIRRTYLAEFARWVDSVRVRTDVTVQLEPAWLTPDHSLALDGELGVPKRVDLAVQNHLTQTASTVMVESRRLVRFEPQRLTHGRGARATDFELRPFAWDHCRVAIPRRAVGGLADSGWGSLRGWFMTWFRPEVGAALVAAAGWQFHEVCHFLSDPEDVDETIRFGVDLGSAPVDAFVALLDLLADAGVAEATLGNP